MMKQISKSIRAKFTLIFIGILFLACMISFTLMHLIWALWFDDRMSEVSVNYTSEQIHEGYFIIMLTLLICVVTGSVLMYLATKRISKPIKYISNITKEVSKGNFDIRIDYQSEDEIGILADNFNLMIDELNHMEVLRKDFISNVSHEFKTPISAIHGFVWMIKNNDLSEEKKNAYIDIIMEETERLGQLSSNILRLSRLDNQNMPDEITKFYLDEQLRKIILLLEDKWQQKNLQLDIRLDKVLFLGDEGLLQQVWVNLLENAIKFSYEGGTVTVTLKNHDENILVTIRDNGIGISKEHQKRIFEKFYQGETSHSKSGNGLGLAIVKRIVEICKGEIRMESEEGKGTSFNVVLPNGK